MSVDTQETVAKLFGKKGSMDIPPKDDDVFDDIKSDFGASCTSGDVSTEGDLEALDALGSGSTVGGLSSSFSGVPTHSDIVQLSRTIVMRRLILTVKLCRNVLEESHKVLELP